MLNFNFKVKLPNGQIKKGEITASSKAIAISLLKKEGFYILSIIEKKKRSGLNINISFRVPTKIIILFTKQLAIMLQAKLTIIQTLGIIAPEIKNKKLKKTIEDVIEKVKSGSTLSAALESHPKVFNDFYVGLIKIGESSGELPQTLLYLAKYLEKNQRFKTKMFSAMAYPACLLLVMIIISAILFLYVIPEMLIPVLEKLGGELPPLTIFVIGIAEFFRTNIIIIISIIILLIIGIGVLYKTPSGRYFFDKNIFKIPLLGSLIKKIYIVHFIRNFSVSISNGISIVEALTISKNAIPNKAYKKAILEITEKVIAGNTLSSGVKIQAFYFSSFFLQMLLIGEKVGLIKESIYAVSDIYEEEIDNKIDLILQLFPVVIMVIMGIMVLIIVLAIFLPIIQITAT